LTVLAGLAVVVVVAVAAAVVVVAVVLVLVVVVLVVVMAAMAAVVVLPIDPAVVSCDHHHCVVGVVPVWTTTIVVDFVLNAAVALKEGVLDVAVSFEVVVDDMEHVVTVVTIAVVVNVDFVLVSTEALVHVVVPEEPAAMTLMVSVAAFAPYIVVV
jgi:hypothetical protein